MVVVDVDTLLSCLIWCNEDVAWCHVRFVKESDVEDRGFNVRTLRVISMGITVESFDALTDLKV